METVEVKKAELKLSADDPKTAYLKLPDHPGSGVPGAVSQQMRLADLIDGYKGPDMYLDFDGSGCLIGIEILI